jgi:hypothetical protein
MKIVTYLLAALLCAALGAAAIFYFYTFQPMAADYARMKAGMPELDKAKAELKSYKDKVKQESAWIAPLVEMFNNGLNNEIRAGKAEVISVGNTIIVNIAEDMLYTPASKTFAKDTQTLLKLASLLKKEGLKEMDVFIGNTTEAVAGHGKGKKRVPPKDALTLASERSEELVKYLEKYGAPQESLAALAYPTRPPDRGFKIKNRKTIVMISALPAVNAHDASAANPESAPSPQAKPGPVQGAVPRTAPKAIPIKPAQPHTN